MHGACGVALRCKISSTERELLTLKNMEVIIRCMSAGMTLCSNRRTEKDQVLGNGCMNDVHRAHGTTSVVEHPLVVVPKRMLVQCGANFWVFPKLRHDLIKNEVSCITVLRNSSSRNIMQLGLIEYIKMPQPIV